MTNREVAALLDRIANGYRISDEEQRSLLRTAAWRLRSHADDHDNHQVMAYA